MSATRTSGRTGRPGSRLGRRRAFTAIELLVVVLVVGMLAGMLMPAMARLREGERTRVCLNTLKQMGYGVLEYAQDHDGTLPGPIHLTAPFNAGPVFFAQGASGESYYRQQLTTFLAPYVVGYGGDTRPGDAVPYCPSADAIPVASSAGQPWTYQPRSYYVANSGAGTGTDPADWVVRYKTDPPDYFGHMNQGQNPLTVNPAQRPKKLDTISNSSTEWAIADLWYWYVRPSGGSPLNAGTWPFELANSASGTIANTGKLKVPSFPFHLTAKRFDSDLASPDTTFDSPRLTSGKTNAVFFDGHAASVSPWLGTVNPRF